MAMSSATSGDSSVAVPIPGPALETMALAALLLLYIFVVLMFRPSMGAQIVFSLVFLILLLALSWKNFRKGMHPVFLFLGLLLLFQGGGLFAYILSRGSHDPLLMQLSDLPFDVSTYVKTETLLLLMISAFCVYAPVRVSRSQVDYTPPERMRLLPFLVVILIICLPFHFWKNYEYLLYVRSHGGYLAIFRSDEHITEVGFVVRALSQLCSAAFLVYFVYERPRFRMFVLSLLYFCVSIVELLIGLRGKILLLFVCFLFLWKLNRGTVFGLRGLFVLVLVCAAIAQSVVIFRENKAEQLDPLAIPAAFLSAEGISLNVTEAAIAFYPQFAPYRWDYLANSIHAVFQTEALPQARAPQGEVLDNDSSMFLNQKGFELGFGTGGSYIAEGYVFGRVFGVIAESLLIAAILILVARNLRGWRTPYALTVMLSIVYLPRANLTTVLSNVVHSCVGILGVFLIASVLAQCVDFLGFAAAPAVPSKT